MTKPDLADDTRLYLEERHFEYYRRTLPIERFKRWLEAMREFGYGVTAE